MKVWASMELAHKKFMKFYRMCERIRKPYGHPINKNIWTKKMKTISQNVNGIRHNILYFINVSKFATLMVFTYFNYGDEKVTLTIQMSLYYYHDDVMCH
jgi:hypothetical protein